MINASHSGSEKRTSMGRLGSTTAKLMPSSTHGVARRKDGDKYRAVPNREQERGRRKDNGDSPRPKTHLPKCALSDDLDRPEIPQADLCPAEP